MKTCPVCKARCFDDMEICYGCLYRFKGNEQPCTSAADEATVPLQPVCNSVKEPEPSKASGNVFVGDYPENNREAYEGASAACNTHAEDCSTLVEDGVRHNRADSGSRKRCREFFASLPCEIRLPLGQNAEEADAYSDWLAGGDCRLVLDVRLEPVSAPVHVRAESTERIASRREPQSVCSYAPVSSYEAPEENLLDTERRTGDADGPSGSAAAGSKPAGQSGAEAQGNSAPASQQLSGTGRKRRRKRRRKAASKTRATDEAKRSVPA